MSRGRPVTALIVDVGNSTVRVAGWSGGPQDPRQYGCGRQNEPLLGLPLPTVGIFQTPAAADSEVFKQSMRHLQVQYPGLPVVVSTVVPHLIPLLQDIWPASITVDHESALPFSLSLPDPAEIGPDRLCNVAAAAAAGCHRALVVDAGTATTFDLLIDGEFIGGLIAPGMALASACLAEKADRLAPVPFAACPLEPGRDTASAMQAGAFHVGVAGVGAVIQQLCRLYDPLPVVLTGGLAELLVLPGYLCDPDWTLRGAAILSGLKCPPPNPVRARLNP